MIHCTTTAAPADEGDAFLCEETGVGLPPGVLVVKSFVRRVGTNKREGWDELDYDR